MILVPLVSTTFIYFLLLLRGGGQQQEHQQDQHQQHQHQQQQKQEQKQQITKPTTSRTSRTFVAFSSKMNNNINDDGNTTTSRTSSTSPSSVVNFTTISDISNDLKTTSINNNNNNNNNNTMKKQQKNKKKQNLKRIVRSQILQIGCFTGQLCHVANVESNILELLLHQQQSQNSHQKNASINNSILIIINSITKVLFQVIQVAKTLNINLQFAVTKKIELNKKKYPVELCKGKAGKYTEYSKVTGVTKTNQSIMTKDDKSSNDEQREEAEGDRHQQQQQLHSSEEDDHELQFVETMPLLAKEIESFALERSWSKYHTPRNIILALLGEVGELAELVQWIGDTDEDHGEPNKFNINDEMLDKLCMELADVTIYLLRLTTLCHVTNQVQTKIQNHINNYHTNSIMIMEEESTEDEEHNDDDDDDNSNTTSVTSSNNNNQTKLPSPRILF